MLTIPTRTIHKVNITAEAIFDVRESLEVPDFDFRALRKECEEWIEGKAATNRIPPHGYFHTAWNDEASGRWFEIFFYKGETIGTMVQYWDLAGVCFFEDWHEYWEDGGYIRNWLKTRIDPPTPEDDFAVRVRVAEIFRNTEKTAYNNFLKEVLNEFDHPRDKAAAEELAFLQSVHFRVRPRKPFAKKSRGNRKPSPKP